MSRQRNQPNEPNPGRNSPPLTRQLVPAYVPQRVGGGWRLTVIQIPVEILNDPAFVLERVEPTFMLGMLNRVQRHMRDRERGAR